MNNILYELDKNGIIPDKIEEIRKKDGIFLYRIYKDSQSYVLKYFDGSDGVREIEYYALLEKNHIPTLKILVQTECSILMEDLLTSSRWRLGTEDDMNDPVVAQNLAQWYRTLHDASGQILPEKDNWYSEVGLLTKEKLMNAALKTDTGSNKVWMFVIEHLHGLFEIIRKLEPVLNYNDFYYTNLAVGRSGREAIMFDYNCMGKGYRASDVRNVCVSLNARAADAFRESYGAINEYEYKVDDVISMLTTLVMAADRKEFPWWAEDAVRAVRSGKLESDLKEILSLTLI